MSPLAGGFDSSFAAPCYPSMRGPGAVTQGRCSPGLRHSSPFRVRLQNPAPAFGTAILTFVGDSMRWFCRIFLLATLIVPVAVRAQDGNIDPPGRVGRVSFMTGPVSLYPSGGTDWT